MKKINIRSFWIPVVILLLASIVVIVAPEEKEIAAGIKPVYVHVALTWTGSVYLLLCLFLAMTNIFLGSDIGDDLLRITYRVGLIFYLLGFVMSIVASIVNWGGINFFEQRFLVAGSVTLIGLIIWGLINYSRSNRLNAIMTLLPSIIVIYFRIQNSIGLHPDDPVKHSPLGIRDTFRYLFLLMIVLSVWLWNLLYLKYRQKLNNPAGNPNSPL